MWVPVPWGGRSVRRHATRRADLGLATPRVLHWASSTSTVIIGDLCYRPVGYLWWTIRWQAMRSYPLDRFFLSSPPKFLNEYIYEDNIPSRPLSDLFISKILSQDLLCNQCLASTRSKLRDDVSNSSLSSRVELSLKRISLSAFRFGRQGKRAPFSSSDWTTEKNLQRPCISTAGKLAMARGLFPAAKRSEEMASEGICRRPAHAFCLQPSSCFGFTDRGSRSTKRLYHSIAIYNFTSAVPRALLSTERFAAWPNSSTWAVG